MKTRSYVFLFAGAVACTGSATAAGLSENTGIRDSLQTSGGASLGVAGVIATSAQVTPGGQSVPLLANVAAAGAASAAVGAGSTAAAEGKTGLGSAATAGQAASAAGNLPLVISDEIVSALPLLVQPPAENKE